MWNYCCCCFQGRCCEQLLLISCLAILATGTRFLTWPAVRLTQKASTRCCCYLKLVLQVLRV